MLPAGTTIEAVSELEKAGFRSAVIRAMEECARKARRSQAMTPKACHCEELCPPVIARSYPLLSLR